jgi:hypothetical protein
MSMPKVGTCYCGCGTATGGHFAPGHDRRAAVWLDRLNAERTAALAGPWAMAEDLERRLPDDALREVLRELLPYWLATRGVEGGELEPPPIAIRVVLAGYGPGGKNLMDAAREAGLVEDDLPGAGRQ